MIQSLGLFFFVVVYHSDGGSRGEQRSIIGSLLLQVVTGDIDRGVEIFLETIF